jgi:predicted ribosomally synthesized peptide with SipW-like signal peptide
MKFKTIAMTGVMSLAGLGLIGAGAHAVFSQNTSSAQTITAGTMNVTVASTAAGTVGNGTQSITLPPTTAFESSSFMESYTVNITNNSNIPVNEIAYTLTDPTALANPANLAFDGEAWVCLYSDGYIYFNEPLGVVDAYGETAEIDGLAPHDTDSYTLVTYAGPTENTGCGATETRYDAGASYTGPDGTVVPNSYEGSTNGNGYTTQDYAWLSPASVPALGTGMNPAALSLVSAAEGGVITPTFTVSYSG